MQYFEKRTTVLIKYIFPLWSMSMLGWIGCDAPQAESPSNGKEVQSVTTDPVGSPAFALSARTLIRPWCGDSTLRRNELWFADVGVLVQLVNAPQEQHVALIVRDTACHIRRRWVLYQDRATDFSCFLADISYNQSSKLVAVRGFDQLWCYDVMRDTLCPPQRPEFLLPRELSDAHAGRILRLELWEYYLLGWAEEEGAFAFDLLQGMPRAVLPVAEYVLPNEMVRSLFLLEADSKGRQQAIIPWYDYEASAFRVQALFERPLFLELAAAPVAHPVRYVLLTSTDEGDDRLWHVVDLQKGDMLVLPPHLVSASGEAVRRWLDQRE